MATTRRTIKSAGKQRASSAPTYGSRTDIGLVREHNEDSLLVKEPLFIVADGMGGHAAGEVASEIAVQTISDLAPETADADDFARAVIAANRAIIQAAMEGKGRRGMGTTITAAILEGEQLLIAQVGDSRAYLLHDNKLQRLTRDHSLVADLVESGEITEEEARFHPNRSVITRALGTDSSTLPDMYEVNVAPGDRLLLCSDGLTSMIQDDLIEHILLRAPEPQTCADRLANAALSEGGIDNITTIVVDIPGNEEKRIRRTVIKSRAGAIITALALLAVIVGSIVGARIYLDNVAFIVAQEGEVVICTGLPGSIFGIPTWEVEERTGIQALSLYLPEATFERLTNKGIRVDSVADAKALIATWEQQRDDDEAQKLQHQQENKDIAAKEQESATYSENEYESDTSSQTQGGVQ